MTKLMVICEGATEKGIIDTVIKKELSTHGIITNSIDIGGRVNIDKVLNIITTSARNNEYVTTFFDYYGIGNKFPGIKESRTQSTIEAKQTVVHNALKETVELEIKDKNIGRMKEFIPYIQMYETEALLFSDPQKIAEILPIPSKNKKNFIKDLNKILKGNTRPEEINSGRDTSPSHRIKNLCKGNTRYEKASDGLEIFQAIGLQKIRNECRLFQNWLTILENLE